MLDLVALEFNLPAQNLFVGSQFRSGNLFEIKSIDFKKNKIEAMEIHDNNNNNNNNNNENNEIETENQKEKNDNNTDCNVWLEFNQLRFVTWLSQGKEYNSLSLTEEQKTNDG